MIFVVLGMHKSGTTLVSQILHRSGIGMGEFDEYVSYDMGNKYERQSCLQLNLDILGAPDFEVLHLEVEGNIALTRRQRGLMREIVRKGEADQADWGFKDPRCCLTYDMWAEELPEHKIVVAYRSPDQIWPRFKWHGKRKYHTNFHRAYAFLKRWHEHNLSIVRILESTKCPFLVVNYHDFMSSDVGFRKLERLAGRELQDCRRPELYRCQRSGDLFLRAADLLLERQKGWSIEKTLALMAEWAKYPPEKRST